MDNSIKEIVWNQFGASIDMLISTITNCPDDYFMSNKRFYYIAYHATIYLDYYLTLPPSDFLPQLTFVQKETKYLPKEVIGDLVPDKIYMRQDVLEYLKKSREKCKKMIYALTDEFSVQRFKEGEEFDSVLEAEVFKTGEPNVFEKEVFNVYNCHRDLLFVYLDINLP